MFIKDHIEAVRKKFPQLQTTIASWWFVIWEGELMGFDQPYKIRIVWTRFSPWDDMEIANTNPRVYVISPALQDREGQIVPHLYYHSEPYLCLYDPEVETWNDNNHSIADTIIPWAAEWLATYELWRVTGKWLAPERHPRKKVERDSSQGTSEKTDRGDTDKYSRIHGDIVRLTGTYTSFPIMRAAAAGRFYKLSRQDWAEPGAREHLSLSFADSLLSTENSRIMGATTVSNTVSAIQFHLSQEQVLIDA